MISARFARLMSVALLAAAACASPARAQSWLENLLSGGARQAAPAPSEVQAEGGAMPATARLPPRRPTALPGDAPEPMTSGALPTPEAPIQTAAAPTAATTAGPLNERQIIERANGYFNGISTLVGDFVQTGADGRRLDGKIYLQRPGRIRFEYAAPATIEIIADGSSVAVRDRKLATQDLYTIGQTPLKFLLRDRINLGEDIRITGVSMEPEGARLSLEDKSTLGGTSKITLFFDAKVENLLRWRIVDPQGFTTIVALSNLDKTRRVDARLFTINYERMLEDNK